jgi:tetratricopeptide (TPR) repeat protein
LVDTGSNDDTVSIARSFGCAVHEVPWRNDFSEARNYGLDRALSDWILYIDADERLSCPTGKTVGELLPGPSAAAARVRFHPRADMTAYAEYRLFRRDPRIRFAGSMHETVMPDIRRVCAEDGRVIADVFDVVLRHYGFEGDQTAKHLRNLPLLEAAIEADPYRPYLRFHLGVVLKGLDRRQEATASFLAGIALASKESASMQARVDGSTSAFVLAEMQLEDGDATEALATAERGLSMFSENLTLRFVKARCLLALGREREAIALATPLLEIDPETWFDPRIAHPKSLFGETCLEFLASAHFRLKNYEQAARYYDLANAAAPGSLEYRAKAELARARATGRPLALKSR